LLNRLGDVLEGAGVVGDFLASEMMGAGLRRFVDRRAVGNDQLVALIKHL